MSIGIVRDKLFLKHSNGEGHPERPERLTAINAMLDSYEGRESLEAIEPQDATEEALYRVHEPDYVARLRETRGTGQVFDLDTAASADSYDAAVRAAGSGIAALRAVWERRVESAFAFLRPPGHHAERSHPMGFCFFNNVAVAAAAARAELGAERVLVIDWDVHHGNGTQHIFYDDPSTLYISLHQSPLFPGTGERREIGRGPGEGFTVNVPLPGRSGDAVYRRVFTEIVAPVARDFKPALLLVSAGFDAHRRDPLAGMELDSESFAAMARITEALASDLCGGRSVYFLEGGYHLNALAESVRGVLDVLQGSVPDAASGASAAAAGPAAAASPAAGDWEALWPPAGEPSTHADAAVDEALREHARRWPSVVPLA